MAEQDAKYVFVISVTESQPGLVPYMCVVRDDSIILPIRRILYSFAGQSFTQVQNRIHTLTGMNWAIYISDKTLPTQEIRARKYILRDVLTYSP